MPMFEFPTSGWIPSHHRSKRFVIGLRRSVLIRDLGRREGRIEIKMPRPRGSDSFRNLWVSVYGVKTRACSRGFLTLHGEDVSIDHRTGSCKPLVELGCSYELVECRCESPLVLGRILGLQDLNCLNVLGSSRLVAGSDNRLPCRNAHTDQESDDRDDDHELDQVEATLFSQTSEMNPCDFHICLSQNCFTPESPECSESVFLLDCILQT